MKLIKPFLFLLTLGAILAAFFVFQKITSPLPIEGSYTFEVKKGESLGHLGYQLEEANIIDSILLFKLYGKLTDAETRIHAGEYRLEAGDTLQHLFDKVINGEAVQRSFTFVEGWNVRELFSALANEKTLKWDNSETAQNVLHEKMFLYQENIEGMFFADTYFYSKGQSAQSLLLKANSRLKEVLESEWENRSEGLPLKTPYEALILASIVEKETGVGSERPLIAGVFLNRLNKKMRLQTDPTVIYGLGEAYQGNITRKHLKTYTEYNTYRIPALPPTPIAIVGRESIHAVLHPKASEYLYFVAKGDGSHYFSATLEEHQKAVRQFQWKRVDNYRSSPN